MAELKTQPNSDDIAGFINQIKERTKREDSYVLMQIMEEVTGESAVMWGSSIIGFGKYHYRYESGREGDWFLTGFSPRKQALSIYIMGGFSRYEELMNGLGKYKTGKGCLYVKKLSDIDLDSLKDLITESINYLKTKSV